MPPYLENQRESERVRPARHLPSSKGLFLHLSTVAIGLLAVNEAPRPSPVPGASVPLFPSVARCGSMDR